LIVNSWLNLFVTEGEPTPEPTPEVKTFTQDEVNAMMAQHKKSMREELDKLKKAGDPVALQKKIKELSDSFATKEELTKQEQEALRTDYENRLKSATESAGNWENRFRQTVTQTEITKAASKYDAWDAEQLGLIVGPNTRVVEDLDAQGQPTGNFKVMTKITIDGKTLELPTDEAVGKLREQKQFANQFKIKGQPGLGATLNNSPTPIQGGPPKDTAAFVGWLNDQKKSGAVRY
jgi:polyhydroxyalkanoate synthesis regulator phasin